MYNMYFKNWFMINLDIFDFDSYKILKNKINLFD